MNHRQTALGLIGYLFIGTAAVLVPLMMPFYDRGVCGHRHYVGRDRADLSGPIGGRILGNLLAGAGSDVFGRQRLVWMSALLLAISLLLTAAVAPWLLFVVGFVVISAAQGALSTGINAMVADANPNTRGRALNVLHGVYGAGAAVSPLVIGVLIERGMEWRGALVATGAIWLLYALAAWWFKDPTASVQQIVAGWSLDLEMLRQPSFLSLFAIAFIYNGVAVSLLGWIALYMQDSADVSTFVAISMISIFYVALTAGRFACAAFAERLGYAHLLLLLGIGAVLTYPMVIFGATSLVVAVGVFLVGLSLSGLFPTAIAYGTRLYPARAGAVSGMLSTALTLGAMLPPLWTGAIAATWGFQVALGLNYIMVPPLVFLAIYLGRVEVRQTKPLEAYPNQARTG
ncbi:MAG: MFS transporter [Caldilineaceae bacterium]|nr:MFS transporter [Caldilineaceae bacterium]